MRADPRCSSKFIVKAIEVAIWFRREITNCNTLNLTSLLHVNVSKAIMNRSAQKIESIR